MNIQKQGQSEESAGNDGSANKISIFQRPFWVVVFALTAAISWGWAYPLIKLGFEEFGITQSMTANKVLFAGVRFFISGTLILLIARLLGRSFKVESSGGVFYILLFSILNTSLHYAFFYIHTIYNKLWNM